MVHQLLSLRRYVRRRQRDAVEGVDRGSRGEGGGMEGVRTLVIHTLRIGALKNDAKFKKKK